MQAGADASEAGYTADEGGSAGYGSDAVDADAAAEDARADDVLSFLGEEGMSDDETNW